MSAAVLSSEPAVSAAELLIVNKSEIKTISHMIQFYNHRSADKEQTNGEISLRCVRTVCIYIFQILRKVQGSTILEA